MGLAPIGAGEEKDCSGHTIVGGAYRWKLESQVPNLYNNIGNKGYAYLSFLSLMVDTINDIKI